MELFIAWESLREGEYNGTFDAVIGASVAEL